MKYCIVIDKPIALRFRLVIATCVHSQTAQLTVMESSCCMINLDTKSSNLSTQMLQSEREHNLKPVSNFYINKSPVTERTTAARLHYLIELKPENDDDDDD